MCLCLAKKEKFHWHFLGTTLFHLATKNKSSVASWHLPEKFGPWHMAPCWNPTWAILAGDNHSNHCTSSSPPKKTQLRQSTLTLVKRYFGSNFFAKSRVSYIRAKPVLLPPPKAVLNPKQKITSAVVLYTLASFSRISAFETFGLPGWRTSTTYKEKNIKVTWHEQNTIRSSWEYTQLTRKKGARNKKDIIKLARLKAIINVCYVLLCSTESRGVNRTRG